MSILVGPETRVLVQGVTGREGEFHTRQSLEFGTRVVAGVTPGKGGQVVPDAFDVLLEFEIGFRLQVEGRLLAWRVLQCDVKAPECRLVLDQDAVAQ